MLSILARILTIWEPETPPVIKAKTVNVHPNVKAARKKPVKPIWRQKYHTPVKPAEKAQKNTQERLFRRGLRLVAVELAACINEVSAHTTTEKELLRTLHRMVLQHPRLKDRSYQQVVQEYLQSDSVTGRSDPGGEWEDIL